jgi:GNAT superfamily N-acetyltransferase
MMNEEYLIEIRPAEVSDTEDMIELTRTIWEGHDYVPSVWEDWLADSSGMLAVAEHDGKVLGLGKLTLLAPGQWWLEGLRTHPEYEGLGIASRLHHYLVELWQETGDGVLRFATSSSRDPVHHLAHTTGFEQIAEFTTYVASGIAEPTTEFRKLEEAQAQEAFDVVQASDGLALAYGLWDIDWGWLRPTIEQIRQVIGRGQAYWWREREGVLAFHKNEEEEESRVRLQVAGCSIAHLGGFLQAYRHLTSNLGYEEAAWVAPLRPEVQQALEENGFQREWDGSVYVYEKRLEMQEV